MEPDAHVIPFLLSLKSERSKDIVLVLNPKAYGEPT